MTRPWWKVFGARPANLQSTGQDTRTWIVARNQAPLDVHEAGKLATPTGKAAILDPLYLGQDLSSGLVHVPKTGGDVVVFYDSAEGRNSKLALIFSDAHVAGGADVATCFVEAGMASVFTPETHAATIAFADSLGADGNIYDNYFSRFDDPQGGERKIVHLPDGAPVPYVHSGWGDGAYPVFTLTDTAGNLCAIYTDFMGYNEDGDLLTPPGFVLD